MRFRSLGLRALFTAKSVEASKPTPQRNPHLFAGLTAFRVGTFKSEGIKRKPKKGRLFLGFGKFEALQH